MRLSRYLGVVRYELETLVGLLVVPILISGEFPNFDRVELWTINKFYGLVIDW